MSIGVSSTFTSGTGKMQRARVARLLAGERGKWLGVFEGGYGGSSVKIEDDTVLVEGGCHGPLIGGHVTLECSYSENKAAIDAYLQFLLKEKSPPVATVTSA
jgi:hypothetical protein